MQIIRTHPIATTRDGLSMLEALWHRAVAATSPVWFEWGNAESLFLRKAIASCAIEKPVYVTGLARAGTSIILESLAYCPSTASHRYHDFPFTPLIATRRWFIKTFSQNMHPILHERSHADGLQVSPASPEAFEEILWSHFFTHTHDESKSQLLDANTKHPAFEAFYRNHIRKLMLSEKASRIIAKGNYNVTRIPYITSLFPDAKIIIAIRHPLAHIASLIKQHHWFCQQQTKDPSLLHYMRQAGHFEFGLDRRIINVGDTQVVKAIRKAWDEGKEVEGWAMYWNSIYSHAIAQTPSANIHIVTYESLCSNPHATLTQLYQHCELEEPKITPVIKVPDYYNATFTREEIATVKSITGATSNRFDYHFNQGAA